MEKKGLTITDNLVARLALDMAIMSYHQQWYSYFQ